jgi:hypothetical protein
MKVHGHLRDQHSVDIAQRVTFARVGGNKIVEL